MVMALMAFLQFHATYFAFFAYLLGLKSAEGVVYVPAASVCIFR